MTGAAEAIAERTRQNETDIEVLTSLRLALAASIVMDHGALTGLADDDHAQYHNDARGDLRYDAIGTAAAAVAAHAAAGDPHPTYTQVVNHTHTVSVGSANDTSTVTGAGNYFAGTTSTVSATTANPAGGVATGTTAGPDATMTHSVTQPSAHTMSGTSSADSAGTPAGTNSAPAFTGSATSVVQPYIVAYFWKRTA